MAGESIDVDPSEVNKLVNHLLDDRKNLPLLNNLGRIMVADTDLNFRAQKSPKGIPWKPIQRKGQILRDKGTLRNNITYDIDGVNQVRIGTNTEYAKTHQFGFKGLVSVKAHSRKMSKVFGKKLATPITVQVGPHTRYMEVAARPFLGFGPRAEKKITKALLAWGDTLDD